jgi:hypothetical protein
MDFPTFTFWQLALQLENPIGNKVLLIKKGAEPCQLKLF